jgi:hypothetical protein
MDVTLESSDCDLTGSGVCDVTLPSSDNEFDISLVDDNRFIPICSTPIKAASNMSSRPSLLDCSLDGDADVTLPDSESSIVLAPSNSTTTLSTNASTIISGKILLHTKKYCKIIQILNL